jgi:hypothetical protein
MTADDTVEATPCTYQNLLQAWGDEEYTCIPRKPRHGLRWAYLGAIMKNSNSLRRFSKGSGPEGFPRPKLGVDVPMGPLSTYPQFPRHRERMNDEAGEKRRGLFIVYCTNLTVEVDHV